MPESSLSLGYPDYLLAVSKFLGYRRDTGALSAAQLADCEDCIQSGYRQALSPKAVGGQAQEWSWMSPWQDLSILATVWEYALPDNFGGLIGDPVWGTANTVNRPIVATSAARVRELQSRSTGNAIMPELVAIEAKAPTGTTGQRYQMICWPTPSEGRTMKYRMVLLVGKLTAASPYPVGGQPFAELVKAAILAYAERVYMGGSGRMTEQQNYIDELTAAIARDTMLRPSNLGPNNDGQSPDWVVDRATSATYVPS